VAVTIYFFLNVFGSGIYYCFLPTCGMNAAALVTATVTLALRGLEISHMYRELVLLVTTKIRVTHEIQSVCVITCNSEHFKLLLGVIQSHSLCTLIT
jgi:hypothetical protein